MGGKRGNKADHIDGDILSVSIHGTVILALSVLINNSIDFLDQNSSRRRKALFIAGSRHGKGTKVNALACS